MTSMKIAEGMLKGYSGRKVEQMEKGLLGIS
jgi:hypothetical protein